MLNHIEARHMASYLLEGAAGSIVTSVDGHACDSTRRLTAAALCDPNVNGIVASKALDRLTERIKAGDVYADQPYTDLVSRYECAERNVVRFAAMTDGVA